MSVTARLDQGDGTDLRHVAVDGREVAVRLYFAVRDDRWRTVPLEVMTREVATTADGFTLTVGGRTAWVSHPLEFELAYRAEADRVEAVFTGRARGAFRFNRIGFCLLQPIPALAGRALELRGASGTSADRYPEEIAPQVYVGGDPQPLYDRSFAGLTSELADGTRLEAVFEGDEFEIEDQRNWSDASYKIYGTPLRLGFPFDAEPDREFRQRVVLTATVPPGTPSSSSSPATRAGVLPPVGIYVPGEPDGTWRPRSGFPDLNRTRPAVAELGAPTALGLGINGSVHADDRWSIAESAAIHGTIARQVRRLYPELPLRLRPLDFGTPAGNWMLADGTYWHEPQEPSRHPLRGTRFAAAWVVASLASLAGSELERVDYFDERESSAPAGRLLGWLAAREGRPVSATATTGGPAVLRVGGDLVAANPDSVTHVVAVGERELRLGPDDVVVVPEGGEPVDLEELT